MQNKYHLIAKFWLYDFINCTTKYIIVLHIQPKVLDNIRNTELCNRIEIALTLIKKHTAYIYLFFLFEKLVFFLFMLLSALMA